MLCALFSPPVLGDLHACQRCSITGLLGTPSCARLSRLSSPLLLLGYLLSSPEWALGLPLRTRSALCTAQPHLLPCGLRLCLLTHHLHCAARSLAGFWCLTPYNCPATLSLLSTPDRAWHCSTHPGDVEGLM